MDFLISVIMAFVYGWKLALAAISYVPLVLIANATIGRVSNLYLTFIYIQINDEKTVSTHFYFSFKWRYQRRR